MEEKASIYYNEYRSFERTRLEVAGMRIRLVLLCVLCMLLTGCGYWIVEDAPVQVGSAVVRTTSIPE